jgi:Basophilic leukemia-expressed protein Bles03
VNAVWAVIARATANNELGIAAKVSPEDGDDRQSRVICVYTKDFTDTKDVSRVVHKLKDLGIVDSRGKPIHYKCGKLVILHENCKRLMNARCVHIPENRIGQQVRHQSFVVQL